MSLRSLKQSIFGASLLLAVCAQALAADTRRSLAVSAIPEALKVGADIVVRQYDEEIEIVHPLEVRIQRHYAITLLNASAENARHLADYSSSLQKLNAISATIYDGAGEVIREIRQKDFKKRSMNIGGSGYSDAELKEYTVDYAGYPFTIEFTSSVTALQSFVLPSWSPQDKGLFAHAEVAIEEASLKIIAPFATGFRYRSGGIGEPVIQHKGEAQEWRWDIAALPVIKVDWLSGNTAQHSPFVVMSLDTVAVADYNGSAASWNSLGAFVNMLNMDRDVLSTEDKIRVHTLTDGLATRRGKISVLYKDMQQRMRYVAVEIGLGGWQTLDAAFVGKNQYGDCKGLSNYMMAMLKEAGIVSYPVLIAAGEAYKPLVRDFPVSCFNHEILCAPAVNDTVWLECTSNVAPAGYLGSFTQDRDALMLTATGGVLVHTPALSPEQNLLKRTIQAKIDGDLAYLMQLEHVYSGYWCDLLRPYIQHLADAPLRQYVSNKFTLPAYTVDSYRYEEVNHVSLPVMKETVSMNATAMATATEKRMFISPVLMPLKLPYEVEHADRNTDFRISHSYTIADSFSIEVPPGKQIENLPPAVTLNTNFGSFNTQTTFKTEGLITVQRKFIMLAGDYPLKDYPAFFAFLEKIRRSEREKVVLVAP